jgi:Flp pilus assembly protein TadG
MPIGNRINLVQAPVNCLGGIAKSKSGTRSRGQAMVEFALLAPLFLFVVFVAITFAVIGQSALAVSQLAYNGARYAAVNPTLSSSQVRTYILSGAIGAPSITANGGSHLTVAVTQATFGNPVTVSVTYDLTSNSIVSSMSTLFRGIGFAQTFPTTLSATEVVMSD